MSESKGFPLEELPDCWMQYYGTILCERCPVGKLCAESKAWDELDETNKAEEVKP